MKNTIGVYGLGVMGANISKNMVNNGERVAVYNYTNDLTEKFTNEFPSENIDPHYNVESFVMSLEKPRKIFLMVTTGPIIDSVINSLVPFLDENDIIMDGGNSDSLDSSRRYQTLNKQNIRFLGIGVSGGEEGALYGPSLMPGGDYSAYKEVASTLERIAAKVDGKPCCAYLGAEGAGHYVKMVHNGIEYADMQLITEAYQFLRERVGLTVEEISKVFNDWNNSELKSYLIEITADILTKKDEETGYPLVDVILDKAGQKGTGKLTSQDALELGVPSSIISEAVFARFLSSMKDERTFAEENMSGPKGSDDELDKNKWINLVKEALFTAKICVYAQGFYQYAAASEQYEWSLNLDEIALIFRGGCIIRADFLNKISDAFKEDKNLSNLLVAPYFLEKTNKYQNSLRKVTIKGMETGLSLPCFSTALSFYDGYRSSKSGANLIQAQRDYFGAHTYQRIDKEGIFHTNW